MTDTVEDILSDIGSLLGEDIRSDPEGSFLYAEAADSWVAASLFKDLGNRVVYRYPSSELTDRIIDLWDAAPEDKKWNALYYTIIGNRFDARFQYEEGWDPKEHSSDRRPRVLKAKFGDKPVDYSDP